MTIDVEEASIDLLVRCTTQSVQNVNRKPRFLSSLPKIGLSTAGIVTRREGRIDFNHLSIK
jgi:hypothetical protein